MFQIGRDVDPSLFKDLIEELEKKPLQMNLYRKNSGLGRSQVFGICKQRSSRYTGSRQNFERPELYEQILKIAAATLPPEFSWLSCQLNQDYQTAEHKDSGNRGISAILGFGDYSGGELVIEETPVSIKNRIVFFDGSLYTHSTAPYTGHRYSLVYHTPNRSFKSIPTYTLLPELVKGKRQLVLREEQNGLIRLWKKGHKCIFSSDGILPTLRQRHASLMECVEE